jgi:hypothetical protein
MTAEPADFDQIADELYAIRPDQFAMERDTKIREARADGHPELARELAKLRRPTQSAWLINLLWRDQREVMDQLFELGSELGQAQARASGADLQLLTAQRRQIEAALIRRGHALARDAGVTVSDSMEREAQETLAAALANPEVADVIRTGRLIRPATYAGFGTPVAVMTPRPPQPAASRPAPPPENELAERAARRARERLETAQRVVDEARATYDAAAQELSAQEPAVEAARQARQAIRDQIEQHRAKLRDLERDEDAADRTVTDAERRRDQLRDGRDAAQRGLNRAERDLADLQSGD